MSAEPEVRYLPPYPNNVNGPPGIRVTLYDGSAYEIDDVACITVRNVQTLQSLEMVRTDGTVIEINVPSVVLTQLLTRSGCVPVRKEDIKPLEPNASKKVLACPACNAVALQACEYQYDEWGITCTACNTSWDINGNPED